MKSIKENNMNIMNSTNDKVLTTKIKRWGNGNGILLPKVLLEMLSLKLNDSFRIRIVDKEIVLTPVKKSLTLSERFAAYQEKDTDDEYWTDDPVGKEFI